MERKKYPIRPEDYDLYEMIGQGASAVVQRALCVPHNEIVAIKILDFERHGSDLVLVFLIFFYFLGFHSSHFDLLNKLNRSIGWRVELFLVFRNVTGHCLSDWVQSNISREAQTMILIDHPNVLNAHCSFVKDHTLWVVMPYMAGGSCLHIMKSAFPDGFEELIIATILKEVLKGLDYLHHHGHIHRDVKVGSSVQTPSF